MADATELNDLEGLTQHPGWSRAKAMLARDWGPTGERYIRNLESLANNSDRVAATVDLQIVIKVRREIEAFFAGVESRARQLRNPQEPAEVNYSRRGPL